MGDAQESLDIIEHKAKRTIKLLIDAQLEDNINFDRFFANYAFIDHFSFKIDRKIPSEMGAWIDIHPDKTSIQTYPLRECDIEDRNFHYTIIIYSYHIIPNSLTRLFLELLKRDYFEWSNQIKKYFFWVNCIKAHSGINSITMHTFNNEVNKNINMPDELHFLDIPIKNITEKDIINSYSLLSQWLPYYDKDIKLFNDLNWDDERIAMGIFEALNARISKQINSDH